MVMQGMQCGNSHHTDQVLGIVTFPPAEAGKLVSGYTENCTTSQISLSRAISPFTGDPKN